MSARPRVIIASRLYEPEATAASFRIAALARVLSAQARVEVLTTRPPSAAKPADLDPRVKVSRAPVLRDRTGAIRGYLQYASFDVPLFFRLLFRRADVIVAEAPPTTGLVARVVAWLTRTPLVYYPGDVWTDGVAAMGAAAPVVELMRWMESRVMRGSAAVLSISPEVSARFTDLGASAARVELVGNGIDAEVFTPDASAPDVPRPYFVYTGTMSEWQGPDVFVRALAELADPEVDVRFFGQGAAEEELRVLAEQLVPGSVHFGGVVEPAESARWIRGAIAALVSIVPGIGYDFARPTKTYAAAACGTPVLFAGVGAGGELVRDNDLGVVTSFTPVDVADAMRRLLDAHSSGETERKRTARAEWAVAEASLASSAARAAKVVLNATGADL